jgi:hypothetical protein
MIKRFLLPKIKIDFLITAHQRILFHMFFMKGKMGNKSIFLLWGARIHKFGYCPKMSEMYDFGQQIYMNICK